ncbi:glycosyltransferase family 2 protein [Leptolyngbya sp. KIOST-1]|uniref:glycosyltransferase family 2 protein n=1 Tax=Leptolyngbya sp. KIOST-1 TaxID=1229172 RepID=UPI000907A3F9|nr:glycosyltransferase family 2 protein [Leptolyngbya sp. KIOST-1]
MAPSPLVSVVVPAFNAAAFLAKTLRSVCEQTYQNLEVLVVDDGSTDATAAIVREFMTTDGRVRLLQKPNSGVADARNLGIRHSRGEFIAPLDADDLWQPENLEKQVGYLVQAALTVAMTYAWSFNIDEDDHLTGGFHVAWWQGDVYLPLTLRNFIANASAVVIRRRCLETVGFYDPSLRGQQAQGCEDLELYLRLAARYQVGLVPEFLIGYRQVADSMSRHLQVMEKSQRLVLASIHRENPELYQRVKRWSMRNCYAYLAHQSHRSDRYDESQGWLMQALRTDGAMTLLSHDFYVLSLMNRLKRLRPAATAGAATVTPRRQPPWLNRGTLLGLALLKEMFPARLYERARLRSLRSQTPQSLALAAGQNAP